MHILWVLTVDAIIGATTGTLTSKGQSMGWIANIAAGLIGSFIEEKILGNWGLRVAGVAIVPSTIRAIILVAAVSFFSGRKSS